MEFGLRRLNEQFLSGHNRPTPTSLPFLHDLHTEVERLGRKPYLTRIYAVQHIKYANVDILCEHGYVTMSSTEEMLVGYISMDEATLQYF